MDHKNARSQADDLSQHPHLVRLERYWRSLRKAQRIPARTSLNPSQIDDILPDTFLVQRVTPRVTRFRVAGQNLHRLIKMDPRGLTFLTLFDARHHDRIAQLVEQSFCFPALLSLPLVAQGGLGRSRVNGRVVLLPLADPQGACTRLLGALVTDASASPRARRFALDAAATIRVEPLGPQLAIPAVRAPQNAKRAAPAKGRPVLKLVVDNG